MTKPRRSTVLKKGDLVRVRRCVGLARIVSRIKIKDARFSHTVYAVDPPMSVRFDGDGEGSVPTYVTFSTFVKQDLRKVEV